MIQLNVAAGQRRRVVGTITPKVGMRTSEGTVTGVTEKTLTFSTGARRRNLSGVTVPHSEARKYGYPNANGCTRREVVTVRENGMAVAA